MISVPNQPPAVTLTFPNGTQANPSFIGSLMPTMTWNQTDPDAGTVFAGFHLIVKDEWGNVVIDSGTQSQGTTAMAAQWTLPTSLAGGQKYQAQVQVNDGLVWSPWSNIGWLATNRPPVATMTIPSGTQAAPTIMSTIRPTLLWSQTDLDPGTTFTYFQLQVANEANDTMILDSGQIWQGTSLNSGTWTVSSNLPPNQKLRVRVRVFDGYAWSNWSAQTWMLINRPPTAEFSWNPKPVWEGDLVSLLDQSTDPDGDSLTYSWTIQSPNSSLNSFSSKNVTYLFKLAGDYRVTLTVFDCYASSKITKTINATPLTINSDVSYTEHWLEQHQQSGHNTTQQPKDFYSGEIFVVETRSSLAPVTEAIAWLDTVGKDGNPLYISQILKSSIDSTVFKGQLFDSKLQSMTEGLPIGVEVVHFQIRYSNGVVKNEDIPIRIIGNVNKSVGVHRVQ
jgi:hypothetical protein